MFLPEDLLKAKKRKDLIAIADEKEMDISRVLDRLRYEEELKLINLNISISSTPGSMGNSIKRRSLIYYKAKRDREPQGRN